MNDERYMKIMADLGMPNSQSLLSALQQVANEAGQECAAAEREACAKVCGAVRDQDVRGGNDSYLEGRQMGATVCMNSIRKRSNV